MAEMVLTPSQSEGKEANFIQKFGRAFIHGDVFTKLSLVVWGFGYIGHGQLIKALLVTLVQGPGLYFLGTSGIPALKKFGTLGTVQMEMQFNPITLKNEVNNYDNSFAILLLSVIALVVIASLVVATMMVVQSNYQLQLQKAAGKRPNTFRQDITSYLNEKFYVTLLTLPVLGVVPYLNVDIEDEDSLSQRLDVKNVVKPLDVAIIRLPRLSNFTDFISLEQHPLLGVRYVESTRGLGAPDCIILPGTKNTVDDLLWLRQSGLEAAILKLAERGTPILGVCGGYQMLGRQLDDPTGSESGRVQSLRGLGLLPTRTVFSEQKRRTQVTATVTAEPFAGAKLTGYEIHTGRTVVEGTPFDTLADGQPEGCVNGSVFGTYLHGLFDTGELTEKLTVFLCKQKGIAPEAAALVPMEQYRQQQFDLLADGVRGALDMAAVYRAMGMER